MAVSSWFWADNMEQLIERIEGVHDLVLYSQGIALGTKLPDHWTMQFILFEASNVTNFPCSGLAHQKAVLAEQQHREAP